MDTSTFFENEVVLTTAPVNEEIADWFPDQGF